MIAAESSPPGAAWRADNGWPAGYGGKFERLVSIDIRHDYCNHSGGRFEGISLAPSPVTAERLARYGLIWRPRGDGIDLFRNEAHAASLHDFMRALPDELRRNPPIDLFGPPLLFVMTLKDPLFFNFTDAPTDVREGSPALLLSNRRLRKPEGFSAEFQVSWEYRRGIVYAARPPEAPVMKADSLPPPPTDLPAVARDKLADSLTEMGVIGQAESDDAILSQWWLESRGETASARRELADLQLRARRLPLGLIKIHMIAAGPPAPSDSWNGYPIDLHGDSSDGEENAGMVRSARYVVRFPARSTYWRYLIAGRGELNHSSLVIADSERPDRFAPAGTRELPDGRQASCFEAVEPRPLQQRPESPFVLTSILKGGSDWQKVKTELPAATADNVLPDPHPPPGRCWSDIYVFV